MLAAMRGKKRGQLIAQGAAVFGFAFLGVLAVLNENVAFGPLFFLLSLFYLRKMMKSPRVEKEDVVSCPGDNPEAIKSELLQMLEYYRRLLKSWQWIALFGWILSIALVVYFPSLIVTVTAALAAYSTYAFIRCRQAVRRIENSPAFSGKGGLPSSAAD